ncbi:alcohol dehydrogenase catalytic domain-containing protein [Prescottella equi]|uniref:Chlorophyll synthesis pathway protein BchC n=3 Tax=Rhodococcus hoagii TaxID=43767 RepID=E9SWK6_RHOHA|nr:alcohol dehydrogenase catalytic domain-containing protein [Prescottella equi]EGD25952.1 putative chlorophyll synthesis pathway protein BchC [Prescottella equi ATCC 33707]MBM4483835.1 alcohol dehydrogenase catalytic domain-containing protein [Prescottella equi]MBM4490977.1 alcohol dehydrogenase catalytic domain-containing protein [Prescottella equi]MBM4492720.1 alcohol dehydrogenase catalytic domain-containing protein [Prescottella equi]MBM4501933.1 alcohol dehydrogenase catalytic domain-con
MRAAVLHGIDDLRVEDVPEPELPDGYVLVDVAFNGICGSDLGMIHSFGISEHPHPLTGACGPQILGHEFSGVVCAVGAGVVDVAVGDRVAVQPNYHCGTCARCRDGHEHLCTSAAFHGINAPGGGLAERTAVPAENVHVLPDGVSLEQAAVVEPLAVALHAVELSGVGHTDFALILGAGPIGIATALNLCADGVDRILLSEPSETRRAVATALGLDVIDPTATDLVAAVQERTDGAGADVVFECAGVGAALQTALAAVRPRGAVVLLATYKEQVPLNTYALMFGEMRLMSSLAYSRKEFTSVIDRMAAGAYPLDGWVERVPLADVLDGVQAASDGRRMKVLVEVAHV